ncbi:hypothetical protein [Tahibacter amnicola]|uniref:DUF2135 domain-containing protein n=1 Tax=Tahibacter amnicola TaxID=2976241 RepID=A0ABY6BCX5_9GAMM|nr:hypothetical protein [Tahibacter amnicola]UXI67426.1 hypothetical protein N4264_22245 [Tahibacter amnicola]
MSPLSWAPASRQTDRPGDALAVPLLQKVLTLRGEEPQSRRDLALALSRQPQPDNRRAVLLLWELVTGEWSERFREELGNLSAPVVARYSAESPELAARTPAVVTLQPWNPDRSYLARLRAASEPYQAYLEERRTHATAPAFFLECADYFRHERKDPQLAVRILSNLAEIDLENAALLRVLSYRLQQEERYDLAVPLLEKVAQLRAEEPQSLRDLALALSRQSNPDNERASRLLWQIVDSDWQGRARGLLAIVLHELNDLLARMSDPARKALLADPALLGAVPVDLRVTLTWDADNTDIDLSVTDPAGEVMRFTHTRGNTGSHLSNDFLGGYGPEVFTIRRAIPGTYIVKATYFSDRTVTLTHGVNVHVEFQANFGSGHASRVTATRHLTDGDDDVEIGRFTVKP